MSELYRFEDHYIRVIFIEGDPWIFAEDMESCLGVNPGAFGSFAASTENGLSYKNSIVLELRDAWGRPDVTRLHSLDMALRCVTLAESLTGNRLRKWLEDVFRKSHRQKDLPCKVVNCSHLMVLIQRLGRGVKGLDGLNDLIGTIHDGGSDLGGINAENLAFLMDIVRDEFRACEILINSACLPRQKIKPNLEDDEPEDDEPEDEIFQENTPQKKTPE